MKDLRRSLPQASLRFPRLRCSLSCNCEVLRLNERMETLNGRSLLHSEGYSSRMRMRSRIAVVLTINADRSIFGSHRLGKRGFIERYRSEQLLKMMSDPTR